MKANVQIKGIGIWYYRNDGKFRVFFPFDLNHNVRLSINGEQAIPLAHPNQRVNIVVTNPMAAPDPDMSALMDITEKDKAHVEVKAFIDQVNLAPAHRGVLLVMDKGKYSQAYPTKCRWGLRQKNGNKELEPREITYSGQLDLEGTDIRFEFVPPIAAPTIHDGDRIVFDNECAPQNADESADFQMIYSILFDKHSPGTEFAIRRHPDDEPTLWTLLLDWLRRIVGGDTSSEGKAKMFNNNPVRFQKGLPCNNLKASASDDLPL
jgi:hypothetical protein